MMNRSTKIIIHAFIVVFFLLLSFVINKIPEGTFIAGGDFYQLININDIIYRYLFTWFNQIGQGQYNPLIVAFPFYLFQYILYNVGLSYSYIANFSIFLFMIGSFYSFFFATRIINDSVDDVIRILGSAIYALNIFTFYIFTHPWGFTPHFMIYVFIPMLFAIFGKSIAHLSLKNVMSFSVLFLISTVSFSNIAFFMAFIFFQFVLTFTFIITKRVSVAKTIKRLSCLLFLQLFLSIYFIWPYFAAQTEYVSKISGGFMGDIATIFRWTSTNVIDIFSFRIYRDIDAMNNINLYYDYNILIVSSLGYLLFLIVAILYRKRKNEYWLSYSMVYLILMFLLMRGTPPFGGANILIYNLPGFNIFRSADKLFIFYPFFYLISLILLLSYSKLNKIMIITVLIIIIIIPFPFYLGGVSKDLTSGILALNGADRYKYAIKIPQDYFEIKKIVDEYNVQLSIVSLPYSVVNSNNWANYPTWHFLGNDVINTLYDKFYISANVYDAPMLETNLSFKEYNEENKVDKDKFVKLLQKFSVKYILLHRDIDESYQKPSKTVFDTIDELDKKNIIKRLDTNNYFSLYELDEKYVVPLIHSDEFNISFQKFSPVKLSFQKFSPVKYDINIYNLHNETNITFHQSYNSQWKLYARYNDGIACSPIKYYEITKTMECKYMKEIFDISDLTYILEDPIFDNSHIIIDGYANSWTIDRDYIVKNYPKGSYIYNKDGSIDFKMTIYFRPQSYFYIGIILIFVSGCVSISILIYKKKLLKLNLNHEI